MRKAEWFSEEVLQITEKRREAKGTGEKGKIYLRFIKNNTVR